LISLFVLRKRTICEHARPIAERSMIQNIGWRISNEDVSFGQKAEWAEKKWRGCAAAAIRADVLMSSRHALNPICDVEE
jgi:hypothetical protein